MHKDLISYNYKNFNSFQKSMRQNHLFRVTYMKEKIKGLGLSQQEIKISECGYTCCACSASIFMPVSTHWLCLLVALTHKKGLDKNE